MIKIYDPIKVSDQIILKNRVILPAMASATSSTAGEVTKATLDHYARLSQASTSMMIVEYTYVHKSGRSENNQLAIDDDSKVAGLTRLAKVIKSSGSVACIQLTHAGGKTSKEFTDGPLLSPSGVAVFHPENIFLPPQVANSHEIALLERWFLDAARRASEAGFDMVELHAAHGYGLNQWISPLTNNRTDTFGGSLRKRLNLLLKIVQGIRKELPDLAISVRLAGQDYQPGGLTSEDAGQIAQILQDAGINLLSISSGLAGWRRPRERRGEGYLVEDAQNAKALVSIPVVGVGGIQSVQYIEEALNRGAFDLAAVGRAILNEPAWGNDYLPNKVAS